MRRQYAEQYGGLQQWHWWFRGRRRILQAMLRREVGTDTARTIVTVGCGPPEDLPWLQPFAGPGGLVVGLDADPIHARRSARGIEYVIGRFEEAPLAAGAFDVVLALDVLEHVEDDAAALTEAVRLLRRPGLLVVTVPALPSLWGAQDVVNQHRRRYTARTLRATFARAGLAAPRMTYFNTFLFPVIAAVRWSRLALGLTERARTDFDDNRPGVTNDLLTAVFAAERFVVPRWSLPIGVSLLATAHLENY